MRIDSTTVRNNIPAILTAAISATYFSVRINNILIWILGLYGIYMSWPLRLKITRDDLVFFLPALLFVVFGIGLFWASDFHDGLMQMERRLALVAIPLAFFFMRHSLTKQQLNGMLYAFLGVVLIMSIVCYGNALVNIIENKSLKVVGNTERSYYYFSYMPLTHIIRIDPIYLSLYVNFGVIILLLRPLKNKVLNIFILGYLVLFIVLISSKAGIVMMAAIFALFLFGSFRSRVLAFVIAGLITIALFTGLNKWDFLRERFVVSLEFRYDVAWAGNWNSSSQRMAIWTCAIETIEKNFPLGYGTSDGQKALVETYVSNKYIRGYEDNYNAHNEFIFTWLDTGIFGVTVLIGMIVVPFVRNLGRKDHLFLYFLVCCVGYFLVEAILNRRLGLNFFCFFYGLLAINDFICSDKVNASNV